MPYLRPRHRQAFHDGVCVAQLLVALRQAQLPEPKAAEKLSHAKLIARIVAAITGDSKDFITKLPNFPVRTAKRQPITRRWRTRHWAWQRRTPSWPAAYNLACAYAALAACADAETEPDPLVEKVIGSLEFALCNPECEMEHPSEWIGSDPDFSLLCGGKNKPFTEFLDDQKKRDYPQPVVSQPGPAAGSPARP